MIREFWQVAAMHLYGQGSPERANNAKTSIHIDHIIPISILGVRRSINTKRPLYKFLNSSINLQRISRNQNIQKSDLINFNGTQIRARHYRNNYEVIAQLSIELLNFDLTEIISEDKQFLIAN